MHHPIYTKLIKISMVFCTTTEEVEGGVCHIYEEPNKIRICTNTSNGEVTAEIYLNNEWVMAAKFVNGENGKGIEQYRPGAWERYIERRNIQAFNEERQQREDALQQQKEDFAGEFGTLDDENLFS